MDNGYKEKIDLTKLPRHIAIIMDGNGRWAQEKGEDRLYGHYHGVNSVRSVVEGASELGIGYLTLYAFSTENWDRPMEEVTGLMELLVQTIRKEVPQLNKDNVRLKVIGDLSMLPPEAQREMNEALKETENNTGLTLVLALSYSSRWELEKAVQNIAMDIQNGKLNADDVNQSTLEKYLSTVDIPDPELMIRTGGEHRVSNFLLYQLAYTELYFTNDKWPDFDKEKLFKAVWEYQNRERRFGKTGEQIRNK
ncbi:di-trans,poly-cis-decaprenylcistransferase [Arachidicoccus ginsenosidimutans]|nr:di-trans,poly-cis-decaprenylcistransferase [Arachidicoccus sp. BS20]